MIELNPNGERPPYLRFEQMEFEDRAKTEETGSYVPKFVDMVHVTRPGQKDTLVKNAEDFIRDSFRMAKEGRLPQAWADAYANAYSNWKKGVEGAVDGTPIRGWQAISRGAAEAIIAAGILTVEDLAQIPDQEFARIGTGALAYKQKAQAWIAASKDVGKLAEKAAAQEAELAQLRKVVQEQSEALKSLQA